MRHGKYFLQQFCKINPKNYLISSTTQSVFHPFSFHTYLSTKYIGIYMEYLLENTVLSILNASGSIFCLKSYLEQGSKSQQEPKLHSNHPHQRTFAPGSTLHPRVNTSLHSQVQWRPANSIQTHRMMKVLAGFYVLPLSTGAAALCPSHPLCQKQRDANKSKTF